MGKIDVLEKLGKKAITADGLAQKVKGDFDLLPEIFKGISSTNPRIKYGCAKIISLISEEKPEKLYPKIDFFVELLDSGLKIVKWNAMDVLANLTKVDTKNKFDAIFDRYYGLLYGEDLITVAHVVDNSGKIAKAKPHLTQKITSELLKMENIPTTPHLTQECKNILLGKAILTFGMFFDQIENKNDVISFVKRQLYNSRNATKVKAEKFLKQIDKH